MAAWSVLGGTVLQVVSHDAGVGSGGHEVDRKRVQGLRHMMALESIYPRRRTSASNVQQKIYPYLPRKEVIGRPNQRCRAEIADVPLRSRLGIGSRFWIGAADTYCHGGCRIRSKVTVVCRIAGGVDDGVA